MGEIFNKDNIGDTLKLWDEEIQKLDESLIDIVLPAKSNFEFFNQLLMDIFDKYVNI